MLRFGGGLNLGPRYDIVRSPGVLLQAPVQLARLRIRQRQFGVGKFLPDFSDDIATLGRRQGANLFENFTGAHSRTLLLALTLASDVFGDHLLGVLIFGTIQSAILFDGRLSSWWMRIVVGALLLAFILLQRLLIRGVAGRR